MNKKFLIVFILVIITFNITGCSLVNKVLHSEKPNNYFYTNGLLNSYNTERPKLITFFYSDLYKEKTLDKGNYVDVDNFLKSLKSDYFISKPSTLPEIPLYKIYIEFEKIKYVLNVYNETYVSIYPWDGKYDMDFIDMSSIPINYNIYGVCKYYLPD